MSRRKRRVSVVEPTTAYKPRVHNDRYPMLTTSKGITIGKFYVPPQINKMSTEEEMLQRALLPPPLCRMPRHPDWYKYGATVLAGLLFYILTRAH